MSQGVKIIFGGVSDIYENIYKSIVKNKIHFMNLLAATYHGRIPPSVKLPPVILTGLIRPSDTDNYVSLICYII